MKGPLDSGWRARAMVPHSLSMKSHFWLALSLLIFSPFISSQVSHAQGSSTPQPPQFRLPSTAAPEDYKVELTVAPDKDSFTGAIDIDIRFKQATSVLWLNADTLTIKDATLTVGGKSVNTRVIPEPKDFVGFAFDHEVAPGAAKLHVNFSGEISRKDMAGIFQVKDRDHWYVYSQFENISARRAFPCFDEPGYKVPWQVTLHVPEGNGAFSNTPMLSEKSDGAGMKTVVFAQTKPLPSYLVAIGVGQFDVVDVGTAGAKKTKVRIIVPKGHAAEASDVAKATPDILNLLEKYFDIPYPYEKLDEIAIPYAGYAMEHPGLVTYGAAFFLMNPDSPLSIKRTALIVIAHELAHQWSGDLVTMAWWDDTWLNEAFASWMENKIVNQYRPEWKLNIDELNSIQRAMRTDELRSSRQVRQQILTNDDIDNAFDNITYDKGSGLLSMFESYMGPEKFRAAVQRYLRKYSWKNATASDFLQELSGDDPQLSQAFSSFLDQAGVPLVSMKLECTSDDAKVELSQERFLPGSSSTGPDQLWDIPVCVEYPAETGEARQCVLMKNKNESIQLSKSKSCPSWIYGNVGQSGYYRVAYQPPVLESLASNEKSLTSKERVGLLGDISAFTKGHMLLGDAMALVPKFAADSDADTVSKSLEIVGDLDAHLVPDQLLPNYRRYLSDVYKKRALEIGWKDKADDDPSTRLLRPKLFVLMANHAEDPQFIDQARTLANSWIHDRSGVSADMSEAALGAAAAHGDRALFDQLVAEAKKEKDELAQFTIVGAIAQFRDPELVKSALGLILNTDIDTRQTIRIATHLPPQSTDIAYNWVKENWDALIAKLPTDTGAELPVIARNYCDAEHRKEVESFFTGRSTKYTGGPRTLAQVLERIDVCIAEKEKNQPSVSQFLSKY